MFYLLPRMKEDVLIFCFHSFNLRIEFREKKSRVFLATETQRTQSTELAVEVATRLHVPPEVVLAWNAAKFYGVVECLCNLTAEEEAAAEEARKRFKAARSI